MHKTREVLRCRRRGVVFVLHGAANLVAEPRLRAQQRVGRAGHSLAPGELPATIRSAAPWRGEHRWRLPFMRQRPACTDPIGRPVLEPATSHSRKYADPGLRFGSGRPTLLVVDPAGRRCTNDAEALETSRSTLHGLIWGMVLAFALAAAVCLANSASAGVFTCFLIHAHDHDDAGHVHHGHQALRQTFKGLAVA